MSSDRLITRGLGAVVFAGALLGARSGAAFAQSSPTFLLVTTGEVSPSNPETTVEVWAAWEQSHPGSFVFGLSDYDLVAGEGRFTSATRDLIIYGTRAGKLRGPRVKGALMGQLHLPPGGPIGLTNNPIKLAHYTWTTTDFSERTVDLFTEGTTRFGVVHTAGGPSINLIGDFTPGSGSIRVVPGPGAMCLPGIGLVAVRRRRVIEGERP